MKFKINVEIILKTGSPNLLKQVLEPENQTITNGTITCKSFDNSVITNISVYQKISTVINTIDDILKTAILARNISETTKT